MALPQPKVLNLTSEIVFEFGSTRLVHGQSVVISKANSGYIDITARGQVQEMRWNDVE